MITQIFLIIIIAICISLIIFSILKIFINAAIFIAKMIAGRDATVNFIAELYVVSICALILIISIYFLT